MTALTELQKHVTDALGEHLKSSVIALDELTIEVSADDIHGVSLMLRDDPQLSFDTLIDICGVDYLEYGYSEWATDSTNATGYSRGVIRGVEKEEKKRRVNWEKPRFAVVYHLLSVKLNHRVRVRVFPEGEPPMLDSVVDVWNCANWFEREAFDLFGILFKNHPDLRRILTDYGFVGHPFRKDFPLVGEVEMRYDASLQRCVYEPVSIQQRTLVPKVIRQDSRYIKEGEGDVGNS